MTGVYYKHLGVVSATAKVKREQVGDFPFGVMALWLQNVDVHLVTISLVSPTQMFGSTRGN